MPSMRQVPPGLVYNGSASLAADRRAVETPIGALLDCSLQYSSCVVRRADGSGELEKGYRCSSGTADALSQRLRTRGHAATATNCRTALQSAIVINTCDIEKLSRYQMHAC